MANSQFESNFKLRRSHLPVVLLPAVCLLLLAGPTVARRSQFRRQQPPMDSTSFYQLLKHVPDELCTAADLTPRLRNLCRAGSVADRLAHSGLVNGYRACQVMFQHHRWNCTFEEDFLNTGYPQAGFVWAMAAAKAVEELALACRRGQPGLNCPCRSVSSRPTVLSSPGGADDATAWSSRRRAGRSVDRGQQQLPETLGQKYGGISLPSCDDNLRLASRRVRQFFADTRANLRAVGGPLPLPMLVNVHNRRAGQIAARHSQVRICHCLGVSGSCTKQICIKGMRRLSGKLEANLRQLLQDSKPVQLFTPTERRRKPPSQAAPRRSSRADRFGKLVPINWRAAGRRSRGRVGKKDLVHWRPQPDYCTASRHDGYYGVQDRQCNATIDAAGQPNSCERLCCGEFNFAPMYIIQREWCRCQMKSNPIRVDCQQCETRVRTHRCRLYRP
ncbi:hypothetical protein BOX15_Mlig029070g1 [Macrostomum lignano]|uniref:Protein Wnt n=2 Tax=Macrostomum lignano TaxID=282301 RepID=A0A267GXP9_9PLAT|nr:hypothetical protein BOX15_Mlig029070g1 [Macrostomum lignano]